MWLQLAKRWTTFWSSLASLVGSLNTLSMLHNPFHSLIGGRFPTGPRSLWTCIPSERGRNSSVGWQMGTKRWQSSKQCSRRYLCSCIHIQANEVYLFLREPNFQSELTNSICASLCTSVGCLAPQMKAMKLIEPAIWNTASTIRISLRYQLLCLESLWELLRFLAFLMSLLIKYSPMTHNPYWDPNLPISSVSDGKIILLTGHPQDECFQICVPENLGLLLSPSCRTSTWWVIPTRLWNFPQPKLESTWMSLPLFLWSSAGSRDRTEARCTEWAQTVSYNRDSGHTWSHSGRISLLGVMASH